MPTKTICANCNAALEDGTSFCPECGTKVEPRPGAAEETPAEPAAETVFCPECGAKTTAEFAFCQECGTPIGEKKQEGTADAKPEGKKKPAIQFKLKPLYIGIAAAVVVIAAAVIVVTSLIGSGSSGENHLIYAKDNELQFTYLSKPKPFEITDRLSEDSKLDADDLMEISSYICMSDNERYIFYPDRVGNDGLTYYWRDLKADNSKTDAAVKVDSEIYSEPFLSGDGNKLFYVKGDDNRLYVFDRKSGEKTKLDDEVRNWYVNSSGDYLIYDIYADDEYTIYEMTLKGLTGEKTKLDSNSRIHTAYANDKTVYYTKEGTLYFKESGKDKVRIASDVAQVISIVDGESVYYTKTEEVTTKLSALINDDMAASDRDLTDPEGMSPSGNIDPEPEYPSEYDFQIETWVDSTWGNEVNPITGEWGYRQMDTDWEAYNAAIQEYQEKYNEWQAEYNRRLDEYNAAYELYQGKQSRDELRTMLDDENNAVTYEKYDLYYWTPSGDNLVASDITSYLTRSSRVPVVVYQKYNTSSGGSQKLSELISDWGGYFYAGDILYDLTDRLTSARSTSEDVYVASADKESVLDCDNARQWAIDAGGTIYFLDDYNTDKSYGTLMSAAISNGAAAKPVKIDDDVMSFRFGNDNKNVYYFKDVKSGSGDLYLKGKSLASDVYVSGLYNFRGSDTLLYFVDFSDRNSNGTLCIFKGGTQTKIADDVSFFTPVDEKNIAYLSDYNQSREKGDLMLYDGGNKPTLLDSDVTALLWSPRMMWGNYYF